MRYACYFCVCVSFATPAIFRNPRLLHFARYVVIFACVFVYFVTLTLGANASRRLFLPLCAYFFCKYVSFATNALFRNTRKHQIARFLVIFGCVCVYFFNHSAYCKFTYALFLTLMRMLFLRMREFCDVTRLLTPILNIFWQIFLANILVIYKS